MTKRIHYTLDQMGWFCCVLGAANGRPWSGMAAASALPILHVSVARRPVVEMKLALASGVRWRSGSGRVKGVLLFS